MEELIKDTEEILERIRQQKKEILIAYTKIKIGDKVADEYDYLLDGLQQDEELLEECIKKGKLKESDVDGVKRRLRVFSIEFDKYKRGE